MRQSYEALLVEEGFLLEATEQIAEAMHRQGVSQTELAERMGCSQAAVSMVMSGRRDLTLRWFWRMAQALGCDVALSMTVRPEQDVRLLRRLERHDPGRSDSRGRP